MRATLLNQPITTAITLAAAGAGSVLMLDAPRTLCVQANFVYGSGGTTIDAYLQTSLDGGSTWIDICNFHFTTSAARFVYNLSGLTAVTTEYTATDGSLSANTAKDGVLGPLFRVKLGSTGTYASTSLQIDVAAPGL
jgi:hypothetical protein